MDVEIVRMSSKGQFVLPLSIRKRFGIGKGEKLIFIEQDGMVVVRPVSQLKHNLDDELYLMRKAADGWAQIEKGNARKMGKNKFLKELEAW